MFRIFLSATWMLLSISATAQRVALPSALQPITRPGHFVLDFAKGNIDDDSMEEYIVVYAQEGEDTATLSGDSGEMARTVVVLKAGTNGQLRIVAENSGAVLCRNCGGVMGDPFQGIAISNGRFTFQHYGGSSWRWTAAYTFEYDRAKKDWFLFEDAASTFHSGDPETTETTTVIRRAETGDIRFSDFTTSYNTDSTTWTVKAAKTFFYQSPDLATKPRKAYLVKGDTFNGVRQFRNFIEGYFENSKGITSGFLLRKDVAPAGNTKAVQ